MPVRSRSASSISAMICRPDRLIVRSTSSASSTPSRSRRRRAPAPAARRRACARSRSRTSAQVVEARAQAAEQWRPQVVERLLAARHRGNRLFQRHQIARSGSAQRGRATRRSRSWTSFRHSRKRPRSMARKRVPRHRPGNRAPVRAPARGGAASARSSRPPIDVTVRSISCRSEPAVLLRCP